MNIIDKVEQSKYSSIAWDNLINIGPEEDDDDGDEEESHSS